MDPLASLLHFSSSPLKSSLAKLANFQISVLYMVVQNLGLAKGKMKESGWQYLCDSAALCYLQLFLELSCWYNVWCLGC